MSYYDPDFVNNFEFSEQIVRRYFIRKVYSLLFTQLLVTFGIITIFVFQYDANLWAKQNLMMLWIGIGVTFVIIIALGCCEGLRRQVPINFMLLAIFTLAQSFTLGMVCAFIDPYIVLMAVGITAAVSFALTLFAFQTRWDFTILGGSLFVALIVFMIFGIFAIIFPGRIITLVYGSIGALLFCIYLVYDTQLMMGGLHKYAISPEEYIFAALNLYTDIVQLFLQILIIVGLVQDF